MTQSFLSALLGAERPVIMEVKSRDAHGADLLRGRTPGDIAAAYERAGAPCVSVVTGRWFGGSAAMLHEVTARVDVPVLLKDFVTRRDQVTAAARAGVSAVLLTAALLPRESLHDLARACQAHGLTPFVEITGAEEAIGLPNPQDCVVAVNNKDITARERDAGDLDRSRALLPAVRAAGTLCPVSASAVSDPATAAGLLAEGYRGLLIGTALLRAPSVDAWLAEFDAHRAAGAEETGRVVVPLTVEAPSVLPHPAPVAGAAAARPDASAAPAGEAEDVPA
ncbi:indole-3-glycerol-phosphate synthase [Streptomyces sp. TRM75563]|uniref:indole-3-glycerol-phosphate synthase n=2 Tax=unclassified Streptomyces TaxID=2593676 RepID=UPI001F6051DA|nr:indole-3-glycerol-phosphate synthase [Streptomyces sp. TRM75563]MCI4046456.1 indole-3-glycerol-phosphate synthase [Streptomyces sp. TRM75563]